MTRLLDDLLDVGRIANGKVQMDMQHIALATVIESAIEASRPRIEQAMHRLVTEIPTEPIYIDGDAVRLAQVFANLLNNAAKYTGTGGTIKLICLRCDPHVEVTVEDNGIGISEEEREKIFDIFAQSDQSDERADRGLGIGLFLVKAFTELHGGTVSIASDGPKRGSRFVVRLPLSEIQDLAPAQTKTVSQQETRKSRILIADDNYDAAAALAEILTIYGDEVRIAQNGQEAIEVAEAFHPHVGLIDIGMPGLNGYEVATVIRKSSWGRNVVLVAITGWGTLKDKARAIDAGFDHHLTKPARFEDIQEILSSMPVNRSVG